MRIGWLGLAALLAPTVIHGGGCADDCEDAVELCRDCDVAFSSCAERFENAPLDVCEQAIVEYERAGCRVVDNDGCESDYPEPYKPSQ